MKVRVRGIYSTAITKLLLDKGVEITQPTDALKQTLKIEDNSEPTITIDDLETKDGIYIYGEGSEKIADHIKETCKNSVFYREDMGRIYCGIIKSADQQSQTISIDLGNGMEGVLSLKDFWGYVKPGTKVMVQSKGTYSGKIMLSTQLRLFGKDLVIIKNGFTKMSRGIRSKDSRTKLYDIAKNFNLKDWGILWIQGAENKDEAALKDELSALLESEKNISTKFEQVNEPCVLYEGIDKYFVLFDREDKKRLDDIRKSVMPTISGHHQLKSAGYAILTDFAEELLDKVDEKHLKDKLSSTLLRYGPVENRPYKIIFTRLNGTTYKIEGMCKSMKTGSDDSVEYLEMVSRNSFGERTYKVDTSKNYIEIEEGSDKQRLLTLKPEIFSKFAKVVEFDVSIRKRDDKIERINENRLNLMINNHEIGENIADELKAAMEEKWL